MSEGEAVIEYVAFLEYKADVVMPGVEFMWSDHVNPNQSLTTKYRTPTKITCLPNAKVYEPPEPRCGD